MIILNNLWNETFSRNHGWMNQQRSVNDRTTHSYFVVPAWLFLISQQFENLEAGPETQVLAIVTLPISRCLSRWRKKEPSTFDVSDCGVTEPVPLVQRSLHSFVSQLFEKEKKGGKKRRGRERRKKKKRKEGRKRENNGGAKSPKKFVCVVRSREHPRYELFIKPCVFFYFPLRERSGKKKKKKG